MFALTPGHKYELDSFEGGEKQQLQFIQKEAIDQHPLAQVHLRTVHDGTTNEEVLLMLIDRLKFQGEKLPCKENSVALTHIETALLWLNKRTQDRKARGVEGTMQA